MSAIPATLTTACGGSINVTDATRQHLEAHPEAAELLVEAVGLVTLGDRSFLLEQIEMGRVIGLSALVEAPTVALDETATFACRVGREVPSRVVVGVDKPETSIFTLIAGKQDDGTWLLYTGYAGPCAPREPTDPTLEGNNASELAFWSSHALVWDESWQATFESTWAEVLAAAAE